ncbi:glycosyltransferase family 4 protein [Aquimarina pacifica]|uniref:glycosyltransferase family 4 protein n=1 Tax=Aquimarina pacifica TaxID=1296415 RepID=UPI00046F7D47|nr:glycosyltransferase family 4 protein [Aquimarina pacifica]
MKIVFIIDQVYLHGGIERVLSIKANYFASLQDTEVYIITSEQKNQKPCYEFDDKIIFEDLEINYERRKSYFHPTNLKKLPKHIFGVRSAIKRIQPDVIVVCSHSTDTYFMPFINKKVPKIKEFHYSKHIEIKNRNNPKRPHKKYFFKFTDFVEKKYDQLVILNKDEASYYKSNNTRVIPNPLTFYPSTTSQVSNPIVIAAGRIAQVKGYDILIDIWSSVYKKNKDWQLHIYGSGEPAYIKMLQDKIDGYGLQNVVILKGATDSIQSKMLDSSIFAMTSHNECFPLVLLEAQACGLPIVSFDCPNGPRNIISSDSGILIPLYDNAIFSEQLLNLMKDPDTLRRLGEHARENASNFKLESVMQLWRKLFNDVTVH